MGGLLIKIYEYLDLLKKKKVFFRFFRNSTIYSVSAKKQFLRLIFSISDNFFFSISSQFPLLKHIIFFLLETA